MQDWADVTEQSSSWESRAGLRCDGARKESMVASPVAVRDISSAVTPRTCTPDHFCRLRIEHALTHSFVTEVGAITGSGEVALHSTLQVKPICPTWTQTEIHLPPS